MGGYATYIWPSFIVTFTILAIMAYTSLLSFKQARRSLSKQQEERLANPDI